MAEVYSIFVFFDLFVCVVEYGTRQTSLFVMGGGTCSTPVLVSTILLLMRCEINEEVIMRLRLSVGLRMLSSDFSILRRLISNDEGVRLLFRRCIRLDLTLDLILFEDLQTLRLLLRIVSLRNGSTRAIGDPYEAFNVSTYVVRRLCVLMGLTRMEVGLLCRVDAILITLVSSTLRSRHLYEISLEITSSVLRVPLGNVGPTLRMRAILSNAFLR